MKNTLIKVFATAGIIGLTTHPTQAAVVTFESFPLAPESHWDGSDLSGTPGPMGSFGEIPRVQEKEIEGVYFRNTYTELFGSWTGFAVSNHTDTTTPGYGNQYSAFTGSGAAGSANYIVGYFTSYEVSTNLRFSSLTNLAGKGASFTNTTYAALYSMSGIGQFGGTDGNRPDYFVLTIEGYAAGIPTASIDFYLADFRFTDNSQDYLVDDWRFVDFSALGTVDELRFTMDSSVVNSFGVLTPTYFAMDNFLAVPEPSSLLAALSGLGLILRRKR